MQKSKHKTYLDYAATSPVDPEVVKAMRPLFTRNFGNPSSIHEWGRKTKRVINQAREKVSKALNCETDEVYFTGSATESNNTAILGIARANQKHGKHLITTTIEHHAVLETFRRLESEGFQVTFLKVDKYGLVDPKKLMDAIRPTTTLVSVMYANNEVGTIQPLKTISTMVTAIRRRRGKDGCPIYFHTDASAAKYLPWDVKKIGVDSLTLSPHKFGGPKGIGILFLKKGVAIDPVIYGGGQESGLRPGTENVPSIVGAGVAVEILENGKSKKYEKMATLQEKLVERITTELTGVKITGHPKRTVPDIVSIAIKGVEGESIILKLDHVGIAASTGSACTSDSLSPSHVLLGMGVRPDLIHGSLRISFGIDTKPSDLDYFFNNLKQIIQELRQLAPPPEAKK